jgi:hypothetical protein
MTTLESEFLTSQILSGIILPDIYTNLRVNVASLKIIDASNKLLNLLEELQDEVVDKFGLLKDSEMKKFYYGDIPELKSLFLSILKETEIQIELYGLAVADKFEQVASTIESHAQSMDYYTLNEGVNKSAGDKEEMDNYDKMQTDLRRSRGVLNAIIQSYGKGKDQRVPTREIVAVGLTPKYKIYLNELSLNLDQVTSNVILSMTISKAFDSIFSLIPPTDLDPYLSDVCENFLGVITNPKSFYTKCKQDEILSSSVGQMFAHCYPGFYNLYQDILIEEYDSMNYQAQLDFQKSFGIGQDNSTLTTLCSSYVKLGFKQQ